MKVSLWQITGQVIGFSAFIAVLGYFSANPEYRHRDPELAQITMSFSHTGPRVSECRKLTADEMAELAANMQRSLDCPRGRLPLRVQLELDGDVLFDAELPAVGIASDGASFVHTRLAVPAGRHLLTARLRDSRREDGFDHVREANVEFLPAQNFTIGFRPDVGGFVLR